jgi:hypothetical protein
MIIEDIINEKCVTFMTEEPMDNIQSAEYFKENILPNEVEITHDDGNYFEVSVNCKSYSCDVYGNGDFITLLPSLNYWRIDYDKI